MSFTVMVLSYNHPETTARTIRSVLRKTRNPIVLVHNGSDVRHVNRLKHEFPGIHHCIIPTNLGYSGGVNAGLYHTFQMGSEWVIFLSNDTAFENSPVLPDSPQLRIPIILRKNTERVDSAGGVFSPSQGKIWHCRSPQDFHRVRSSPGLFRYVPGSAFLVHREIFEKTGGMDTELGTYWDDVDWSQRVLESGYQIELDETWKVRHFIGKTCHKNPLYSLYFFQRNRKRICWKYSKAHQRPILIMSLLRDWAKLLMQLSKKGRWRDVPHLVRAISS